MKHFKKGFFFTFTLFLIVSGTFNAAAQQCEYNPGTPLSFHTDDKFIYDNNGRVAIMRGANFGTCYYPDDLGFGEENIAALQKYGFNFIRLNLGWNFIEPENGKFNDARIKELAAFIEKAQEYGVYTMPDFHQMLWEAHIPKWMRSEDLGHDYLSELSPVAAAQSDRFWESQELQDELIQFIVYQAENFKNTKGLFGYDLFNEPFSMKGNSYGEFEKCCLFSFYEKAIAAVRKVDPITPIILEPHPQTVVLPAYTRPFPFDNIIYSPHVYFPHSYGPSGLVINREESPADVRAKFKRFAKDAEKMKTPWHVGEYGGDPLSYPFTTAWLLENMKMQERYFVGSAIWSFSAEGGGGWNINDAPDHIKPHMEAIIVRPYPQYTAGIPDRMQYDEESKVFRFRYTSNLSICAPTEIFYPAEIFKTSQVAIDSSCDVKWEYNETTQILSLHTDCNAPVEIKVSPDTM